MDIPRTIWFKMDSLLNMQFYCSFSLLYNKVVHLYVYFFKLFLTLLEFTETR